MNFEIIKHANITGIANGAKVTGSIPTTGTHTALYLRCLTSAGVALTATEIAADIKDLVVRLDGEQLIDADAQFMLDRQQYYGAHNDAMNVAGILPISYVRSYLQSPTERIRTALGMLGKQSYSIELDLAATVAKLATIEVYAESIPVQRRLGEHINIRKIPQSHSVAAGLDEITDLPGLRNNNLAYLALHMYCNTTDAAFASVGIIANSRKTIHDVPTALNQVRLNGAGRTPQTNYYHADFSLGNHRMSRQRMGGVVDYRQQVQFSGTAAPGNYTIYTEEIVDIDDSGDGFV